MKKFIVEATAFDKKGNVISKACNDYKKTHPVQKHFAEMAGEPSRIYLHAEILSLLRAGENKVGSLFVARYNSKKEMMLARPCNVCMLAMKAYGVKHVLYTTSKGIKEENL
jgi:deoxycytidylate deaminase